MKKRTKQMELELKKFQQTSKELEALTVAMLKANEKKIEQIRTERGW